jgi:hypothetical protein
MNFKNVSILSLILSTLMTSGNTFAQKLVQFVISSKGTINIDQQNIEEIESDIENKNTIFKIRKGQQLNIVVDEESDLIDLDIYNNSEFSASRVDRDGEGH